ncbi:TPA: hypothetical protein NPP60_004938 [Klebsiella variicola subsp. variicola]|nr:hypothetical protein [Klebsiella variicola subsp. variicola]
MTTKRNLKIEKLLSKAFNNSSKEEATSAFGMAYSYAEKAGERLADFRGDVRVVYEEKIVYQNGGIDAARERELVQKYNDVLARAKTLRDQNEQLAMQARMANNVKELAEKTAIAQAIEIENLRKQSSNKEEKYKNRLMGIGLAGILVGVFIGNNFISSGTKHGAIADTPAPVAAAPAHAPVSLARPSPAPKVTTIETPAPAEPAAPAKVAFWEFNFPYAAVVKGKMANLKVEIFNDGSVRDDVNGDMEHLTGNRYRNAAGKVINFERLNDFTIKLNGTVLIEDTTNGKTLADVAQALRIYRPELVQEIAAKNVDLYVTSFGKRLVLLVTNRTGIQFTDINMMGDLRTYNKASETEGGGLTFTRDDNSGKYVEATGTDPEYGNIVLTSFRGNRVYKVTP